jgi:uncharacterized protein
MELEHSFTVPVPEERAWEVLLDVKRVAPCMPGATLDSVEGDDIKGRIKVKVGPIAMTYAGTAHFTERDAQNHVIVLEASGKETRGAGTASASVRSTLQGEGDQTHVVVNTTLNVTGRPAQFGRGVMAEVGGKLIGIFASNLADMLAAEPVQTSDEGAADEQEGDLDQSSLESLILPVRTYNGLRRTGIHTVDDLASQTREQLLGIEGIGPASVEEIRQKLADRGLTLRDSPVSGNGVAGSAAAAPSPTVPAAAAAPAASPRSETPRPAADTAGSAWQAPNDDAIDLLSVAGTPVLKRAIPVAAVVAAAAVIVVIRVRRRRARG